MNTFIHFCIRLCTLKYTAAQLGITSNTPLLSQAVPWICFVELYHRGLFLAALLLSPLKWQFFLFQEDKSIFGKASE